MWDLGPDLPGVHIGVDILISGKQFHRVCHWYGGLSRVFRKNQEGEWAHRRLQGGGFLGGRVMESTPFFPSLVYLLPSIIVFKNIFFFLLFFFPSGSNEGGW